MAAIRLRAGLRLLYCTPEKIVNSKRFLARLEKLVGVQTRDSWAAKPAAGLQAQPGALRGAPVPLLAAGPGAWGWCKGCRSALCLQYKAGCLARIAIDEAHCCRQVPGAYIGLLMRGGCERCN